MKRAIVVGSRGQDGTFLTQQLRARGDIVLGLDRGTVDCSDGGDWLPVELGDAAAIDGAVRRFAPDEVYYLAAFHHSSEGAELRSPTAIWNDSFAVHVHGLLHFLEAIRRHRPGARLFYASSSLVFGLPARSPQTEELPLNPVCVYGITKSAGMQCCRFYRRDLGLYASVGILYNHESNLRAPHYLSRKIVRAAVRIRQGRQQELVLGDLSAEGDWGYAPDTCDAMTRILAAPEPDDFIVASGRSHRVSDWVDLAFRAVGLDWRPYVSEDATLITRKKPVLIGDSGKLQARTGWRPATSFEDMIVEMVRLEGDAN